MIKELDCVGLNRDLPQYQLVRGDVGTVVLVHGGGTAFEVEFVSFRGETIALVTLNADVIQPVGPRQVPHARAV